MRCVHVHASQVFWKTLVQGKTLSMGNGKLANLKENAFYGQWKTSQFTEERFPKCYILNRPPLINSTPNTHTNKQNYNSNFSLFTLSFSTDRSWTSVDWLWTDVDWELTSPKYLFLLKSVPSSLNFLLRFRIWGLFSHLWLSNGLKYRRKKKIPFGFYFSKWKFFVYMVNF